MKQVVVVCIPSKPRKRDILIPGDHDINPIIKIIIFLTRCLQPTSTPYLKKIYDRSLDVKIVFFVIGIEIGILIIIYLNKKSLNISRIIDNLNQILIKETTTNYFNKDLI